MRNLLLVALIALPFMAVFGSPTVVYAKEPAEKQHKGMPGVPDAKMKKAIDKAIADGAAWLRAQQKASGELGAVQLKGAKQYPIGATALSGLALLAAGDKRGDEHVDKVLTYLTHKDAEVSGGARTTYDTGVLLMFLTKYFRAEPEKKKRRRKSVVQDKTKKGPCQLPKHIYEWVRALANHLVQTQKPTGDWGYPHLRPDYSNTQYALLGLREAKDCGIPIPPQIWMLTIERALSRQEQDGPKVNRIIPPKRPGGTTYVIKSNDRARGWTYTANDNVVTGSMTTAGIAILQIAHDGLMRPRKFPSYRPSKQLEVSKAIQDGFAWLDVNFAVDKNPGRNAPAWHYYYLYGLERAAVLGGRSLIGQHDWYLDGARYLLSKQHESGKWSTGALGPESHGPSDIIDTAWAILFLKKATRPLEPIPAPVVTD